MVFKPVVSLGKGSDAWDTKNKALHITAHTQVQALGETCVRVRVHALARVWGGGGDALLQLQKASKV